MLQKKQSSGTKCFNDTACWGWAWSNPVYCQVAQTFPLRMESFQFLLLLPPIVVTCARWTSKLTALRGNCKAQLNHQQPFSSSWTLVRSSCLFQTHILPHLGPLRSMSTQIPKNTTGKSRMNSSLALSISDPSAQFAPVCLSHICSCNCAIGYACKINCFVLFSQNLHYCFNFLHKYSLIMRWTHSLSGVTCAGCQNGDRGRRLSFHSLELPSRWWWRWWWWSSSPC